MADRRKQQRIAPACLFQRLDLGLARFRIECIDLRQRHDFRLVGKTVLIGFQLAANDPIGLGHILFLRRNQMQENTRALDMAEEAVAKADAFARPFDQARNIGNDKLAAIHARNAQIGMQRGERIIGNLRLGRCHACEESGLSGIGQADQTGIGNQFQAQPDGALDAFLSGIGAARRTVGRGREMQVAETAIAALGETIALADFRNVADQRFVVFLENLRADRHLEDHVVAFAAGHVAAHAVHAGLGPEMLLVAVIDQRVEPVHGLHPDIAAAPPNSRNFSRRNETAPAPPLPERI